VQGVLAQAPPAAGDDQPFFFAAPPTGFSPLQASDADLATYGFPPRPPQSDRSYANWAQVVANAKYRIANPVAKKTGIVHGPAVRASLSAGAGVGNTTEAEYNWSGVDEVYASPFFAANPNGGSGGYVVGGYQMPTLGYDNCSGYGSYYASMWVGMDGSPNAPAGNEDVLQAGFEAGACPGGYYAWYEWYTVGCNLNASSAAYPCVEYNVNLPLTAGDYTYVTVTYNPTSPHGAAFLSNQTTGQYISVSFSQPSGSPGSAFAGYSAEWIVERPTNLSTGSLFDLANYIGSWSIGGLNYLGSFPAYMQFPSYATPGYDPAGTFDIFNMVCTQTTWDPNSQCSTEQYISLAYYWSYYQQPPSGYNTESIYFTVTGVAAKQ